MDKTLDMWKYLLILVVGTFESYLSTNWALYATDRRPVISSFLMFTYMTFYLTIVSWAIKSDDTVVMVATYCLSCAIGNYISVKMDIKRKEDSQYKHSALAVKKIKTKKGTK